MLPSIAAVLKQLREQGKVSVDPSASQRLLDALRFVAFFVFTDRRIRFQVPVLSSRVQDPSELKSAHYTMLQEELSDK